ncbi:hypothetical protein [Streptomyces atroolivaceus]|uniref:hypothetical protein n=1 Tax=Streptomyces atroolivaceus TaxID=66869 RepID=UPI003696446A
MRHADGPRTHREVRISAGPARVWAWTAGTASRPRSRKTGWRPGPSPSPRTPTGWCCVSRSRSGPGRSGLNAYVERTPEAEAAIIAYRFDELGKGMDATLRGIKDAAERQG